MPGPHAHSPPRPLPQPCPQFIQLHVLQVKAVKQAVVQALCVHPCPSQPSLYGPFGVSEHTDTSCHIQPLRQRRQHFPHPLC